MAKKKEVMVDDTFRAILGLNKTEEDIAEETAEPAAPVAAERPHQEAEKPKKKTGRPKMQIEKKKSFTVSMLPSLYQKGIDIAYSQGKTLSQVITELLTEYVEKNS